MPLILYHTNPCSHTPAIRRVLEALGAQCEFRAETAENIALVEGTVYQASPLLIDEGRIVEDWRLIVRHLDEQHGKGALTAIPPAQRSELFDLCEEIDRQIIGPAAQLLVNPPSSSGRDLLKPFLGSKALARVDGCATREAIVSTVRRISSDPRLSRSEFLLAKLLLEGGKDFLRTDPEFLAKLSA